MDSFDLRMGQLMDQQCVVIEAQNALIMVLQGHLGFLEDQMDALHYKCIVPAPSPETIDLTNDSDDEEMLVEIEEIGGLIEYVRTSSVYITLPTHEQLELARETLIPEEDFRRAEDGEVDLLVREGNALPSYWKVPSHIPEPDLPPDCEEVEYHLEW